MTRLHNANNTSIYQWAKLGDQIDHYDYSYTFLSDYVHVTLTSLENRLEVKDEKIIGFRQLQDDYDIDLILTTIIDVILQSMRLLKGKYTNLKDIKIEELIDTFSSIAHE